jgi:hypothetical protein
MKLRELKYIKPERKRINSLLLTRHMLNEAIGLLVLDGVFETESTARRVIRTNALENIEHAKRNRKKNTERNTTGNKIEGQ